MPHYNPIDLLSLAKELLTTCTQWVVSAGHNGMAGFCSSAPYTLATGNNAFKGINHSSSFPTIFLSPIPVSLSLTLIVPVSLTLGHVTLLFGLLLICRLLYIRAALFLYYTSVLILTKIIPIWTHLNPLLTTDQKVLRNWRTKTICGCNT